MKIDSNEIVNIPFLVSAICPMPKFPINYYVKNMIKEYERMNNDPIFGSNNVKKHE